jgi:hypothetical protein
MDRGAEDENARHRNAGLDEAFLQNARMFSVLKGRLFQPGIPMPGFDDYFRSTTYSTKPIIISSQVWLPQATRRLGFGLKGLALELS